MDNLVIAICFFIIASCSNKMQYSTGMEEVKIKLLPFECIDQSTSVAHVRIQNKSNKKVCLEGDGFLFKGIYEINGALITPKIMYDPVKELMGKSYYIEPESELVVKIPFNDLQFFELTGDEYIVEFEYLNLVRKPNESISGKIPIESTTAKVCK